MANEEHLALLKQGVEAWNRWRQEQSEQIPVPLDLHRVDLNKANLTGANLSRTDLGDSNLAEVNLRGANLHGANLCGAFLFEADLREANLRAALLWMATLAAADLSDANLTGADLSNAEASWANLRRATMYRASLRQAKLRGAKLREANLTEAYLSAADLRGADLSGANLRGAGLVAADLSAALLRGADLTNAEMRATVLNHLDLRHVKGLDTVQHSGSSDIGIQTIYHSRGEIPAVFLSGAGVPESFIEYLRSLTGEAWDYSSCLISHSSKDQAFAEHLYADLQHQSVRCWLAQDGTMFDNRDLPRIDEPIRQREKLLVILSEHSVESWWAEKQVTQALEQEDQQNDKPVLFPIRLDDAVMTTRHAWATSIRQKRHIGDFSHWKDHDAYQKAFARLLRDLQAEGSAPRPEDQ